MAEGLAEAASAFESELTGGESTGGSSSLQARDEGGRFTSSDRPEDLFAPRPMEGDPETGDTRDAGEDERLAARERRVADGWEEREDKAEKPERIGKEEDEEKAKSGDGKPEEEEKKPLTEPTYEITVDGEKLNVPLSEALKGYIREQTFHSRMHKVAAAAQAVQGEASQIQETRQQYMQRLEYLHRTLDSFTPKDINWDQEFARDSAAAGNKMRAAAAIQGQLQMVAQEMARETQARAAEDQQRMVQYDQQAAQYAHTEFSKFVQKANISDDNALTDRMTRMRNYARHIGFNDQEIATTYDSRMLEVLDAAERYWASTTGEQPKPVSPGSNGRVLAPGASTPHARDAGRRSIDDAMGRLAKTGKLDDAASVFQRLLR